MQVLLPDLNIQVQIYVWVITCRAAGQTQSKTILLLLQVRKQLGLETLANVFKIIQGAVSIP